MQNVQFLLSSPHNWGRRLSDGGAIRARFTNWSFPNLLNLNANALQPSLQIYTGALIVLKYKP